MSVSLHRFIINGCFRPETAEYEIDENNNVKVPTDHKKTISLFETVTEEQHYFPSTEAHQNGTCYTKLFTTTEPRVIIVSDFLKIIQDDLIVGLKYWVNLNNTKKRMNSHQKNVMYKHWSLIPMKTMSIQQFYENVENFFREFNICRLVASAEYYLYTHHDKNPDSQILFKIFEFVNLNSDLHPMNSWRYASTLSYLEHHSLRDTLSVDYYRCSIFSFIQEMIRWKHFNLNQELLPIIHTLENEFGMDIDDDTTPRKYIVLKDNPIQAIMSYRLIFHYIHEIVEHLHQVYAIAGNQPVALEKILSGSVKYVYSFAEKPSGLDKRQELIENTEGLISIGYCDVLQTLCVRPDGLLSTYRDLYKVSPEQNVDLFMAFHDRCQKFIQDSILSPELKQKCMEIMDDLICDIPSDYDIVSTLYLYIFDDGSCQIGMKEFTDLS